MPIKNPILRHHFRCAVGSIAAGRARGAGSRCRRGPAGRSGGGPAWSRPSGAR